MLKEESKTTFISKMGDPSEKGISFLKITTKEKNERVKASH